MAKITLMTSCELFSDLKLSSEGLNLVFTVMNELILIKLNEHFVPNYKLSLTRDLIKSERIRNNSNETHVVRMIAGIAHQHILQTNLMTHLEKILLQLN